MKSATNLASTLLELRTNRTVPYFINARGCGRKEEPMHVGEICRLDRGERKVSLQWANKVAVVVPTSLVCQRRRGPMSVR